MIQTVYISHKGEIDIIVLNAMLFSILSGIISIIKSIVISKNAPIKCFDSIENRSKYNYRAKKLYQLKIECKHFQAYHRFSHKAIERCICNALVLDNTGNIQVFYIQHIRNALVAYIDISNLQLSVTDSTRKMSHSASKNEIFKLATQLGESTNKTNIGFREELLENFGFEFEFDTKNNTEIDGIMRVYIVENKAGLEFNKHRISVQIPKGSTSPNINVGGVNYNVARQQSPQLSMQQMALSRSMSPSEQSSQPGSPVPLAVPVIPPMDLQIEGRSNFQPGLGNVNSNRL